MKKGNFIITVDTEGDNLWERATTKNGIRSIRVDNATYIERFQKLCRQYEFVPTYLTDYEMIMSDEFVTQAKVWQENGECEIGMHMHAWNCPPIYTLPVHKRGHNPYAGEYPHDVLGKKIEYLTNLIESRVGMRPKSHRGGRWYIDEWYMSKLIELGYSVDCSITPGVSWGSAIGNQMCGPDYRKYKCKPFYMDVEQKLLEVPPTIISERLIKRIYKGLKTPYEFNQAMGEKIWLRPNGANLEEMLYIIKRHTTGRYLEFMIHSSELMPGGSPTFVNQAAIENLYEDLKIVFERIAVRYKGVSLSSYAEGKRCKESGKR